MKSVLVDLMVVCCCRSSEGVRCDDWCGGEGVGFLLSEY